MVKRVFVTRQIPEVGIQMLKRQKYRVQIYPKDQAISLQELLRGVKGADALLCILTDKIDAAVLDAAGPQLKIVANYAVGFDNIDLAACRKRGVLVTNAPGPEIVQAVAEHTLALILALARRIVEADKFTRAGKYQDWGPQLLLGTDVYGKTLGIVGLGRIGFAVAKRAVKGFGMQILYTDRERNLDFERDFSAQGGSASGGEKQYGARFVILSTLLKQSDFVSLHVPLLPSTRYLISKTQLALMKPTAFLINTSRGPIVKEKSLLHALKNKTIAGAGLDVFECEPAIDCDLRDHLELKKFEQVILTPHIASATYETREAMSRTAAKNIIATLQGKTPPNLVR